MHDKEFIWNPSNCEGESDKLCDVGEYLDYENCKCGNKLVNKLVEECSENIDKNELICNETLDVSSLNTIPLNVYQKVSDSCTIYIVSFAVFFIKSTCISRVFIYFQWYLRKDNVCVKSNLSIQTTIY